MINPWSVATCTAELPGAVAMVFHQPACGRFMWVRIPCDRGSMCEHAIDDLVLKAAAEVRPMA